MPVSRRTIVNLVFFSALVVVLLLSFARTLVPLERIERPYRVHAEFPNAFGVLPNAEVTHLGVRHGTVVDVDRIPGGVLVTMNVDRDKPIPSTAVAAIHRKSALGEPYVDFLLPDGADPGVRPLRPGERIPMSRTTVPLEFSEFLRSAGRLLESVPPEDVGDLLHEAATGLAGRAESLRALADDGGRLAATLAERSEALDRLATNQTRLTAVVARHRGSLGRSLADLHAVSATLADAKGDLRLLLDNAGPFLTEAAELVASQKANLDCDLKVLDRLIVETTTERRLAELRSLLDVGPSALAGVWDSYDAGDGGPWIRVGFVSNQHNPPAQYVPPRTPPPAAPVTPCTSPLRPVAAGAGATRSAPPDGQLPATGRDLAAGAALVALVAVIAVRTAREGT